MSSNLQGAGKVGSVTLCIATYRRADRLDALLDDIQLQSRLPDEVVIVDNDVTGSARPVVDSRIAKGTPFPIRYEIQPLKNISLTRNRTVALASGGSGWRSSTMMKACAGGPGFSSSSMRPLNSRQMGC